MSSPLGRLMPFNVQELLFRVEGMLLHHALQEEVLGSQGLCLLPNENVFYICRNCLEIDLNAMNLVKGGVATPIIQSAL